MNTPQRKDDAFLDLLIKEATEGLSSDERYELGLLTQRFPSLDTHFAEDTIGALTVGMIGKGERMPLGLEDRIIASAAEWSAPTQIASARARRDQKKVARAPIPSSAGWWSAAAALVLAVAGWWPRLMNDPVNGPAAMVANQTPVEVRQELLESGRAIRASWTPAAAEAEPLVGDVVFDPVSQRGFLTFRGIPANDPRLAQYQLWIVDAKRKQPEPVDGGIFNVTGAPTTSGQDVVIAFEAKLPVGQPAAFVVTMEQPGGVVVSKQEKVLALAKVTT